jgi:hypothetical protein
MKEVTVVVKNNNEEVVGGSWAFSENWSWLYTSGSSVASKLVQNHDLGLGARILWEDET